MNFSDIGSWKKVFKHIKRRPQGPMVGDILIPTPEASDHYYITRNDCILIVIKNDMESLRSGAKYPKAWVMVMHCGDNDRIIGRIYRVNTKYFECFDDPLDFIHSDFDEETAGQFERAWNETLDLLDEYRQTGELHDGAIFWDIWQPNVADTDAVDDFF